MIRKIWKLAHDLNKEYVLLKGVHMEISIKNFITL